MMNQNAITELSTYIINLCKSYKIPGAAIGCTVNGNTVIFTYGATHQFIRKPITDDTLFEIASISKTFTAFCIQYLVQTNNISLNMPISKIIPELSLMYRGKIVTDSITISHLLYHTSGLSNQLSKSITRLFSQISQSKLINMLSGKELCTYPGQSYQYTSINYDILSIIIERITSQPFDQFLKTSILEPLKLHHTACCTKEAKNSPFMAHGHRWLFCRPFPHNDNPPKINWASGYIVSNIQDMLRWMSIHMGLVNDIPPIFQKVVRMSHQENLSVIASEGIYYASGWKKPTRLPQIFHDGLNPNFSSILKIRFNDSIGICILSNIQSSAVTKIADAILCKLKNYSEPPHQEDSIYLIDKKATNAYIGIHILFLLWCLFSVYDQPSLLLNNVLLSIIAGTLLFMFSSLYKENKDYINLSTFFKWAPLTCISALISGIVLLIIVVIECLLHN